MYVVNRCLKASHIDPEIRDPKAICKAKMKSVPSIKEAPALSQGWRLQIWYTADRSTRTGKQMLPQLAALKSLSAAFQRCEAHSVNTPVGLRSPLNRVEIGRPCRHEPTPLGLSQRSIYGTKRLRTLFMVGLCMGITGCSVSIDEEIRADNSCFDLRDNSTFTFKGETMRNPQWSPVGESCFDVTDDSGFHRTICKSHEVWLKCKPGFYRSAHE